MRGLLVLWCIVSFGIVAQASSKTILQGKAPDYAKQILTVFGYSDYISGTLLPLAVDTVNADGTFRFVIDANQTIVIRIPLGIYTGTMFIDTAQTYELVLPNFKPISKADKLNPYFEPQELYLGISNIKSTDINLHIQEFESR